MKISVVKLVRKLRPKPRECLMFADLDDVQAIGNKRGGLVTNKAGRTVLRARCSSGQDIKLFEAASPQHAEFIAAVSSRLPDLFPKVLELRGAWVIAEWVSGQPIKVDVEERQAAVLQRIHSLPLQELPDTDFCYMRDFIVPRYLRAATLAGTVVQQDEIVAQIECPTDLKIVMHPDISPDNLLETDEGRVVCIDNELLCVGRSPLLDVCNAMRPLTTYQRKKLSALWFGDSIPSNGVLSRTAKAWVVREAGAAFIGGQFSRCSDLLDSIDKNAEDWLPTAF